jgi:hypothetical protein
VTALFSRQALFPRLTLPPGEAPRVSARTVGVTAVTAGVGYLLLTGWILPGVLDILAALPVGIRLGILLLASSATRILAGWVGARSFRRAFGIVQRLEVAPSVAIGAVVAWLFIAVVAIAGTSSPDLLFLIIDAVRWPAEAVVGALLAFPGGPGHSRQEDRWTQ